MKIVFGLGWAESRIKFKDPNASALFDKYRERIGADFDCTAVALPAENLPTVTGLLWLCERSQKSRMLPSDELAGRLSKVCDSGVKILTIWIGGPDGLPADILGKIKADLIWSFGPMTLPHELAAVVAAEQVYRAASILKNHPYHTGH